MSAKRVLLTGASGFIGRHCIAPLQARGYEVHAVSSRAAPAAGDGARWHVVDLLDTHRTAALVDTVRPHSLLHLAWYAEHGKFWQSPRNLDWVGASLALIRAFIDAGGRRMTFAGTGAEYDWSNGRCSETTTPLEPQGLYGVCKHALHRIAAAAAREAGVGCAWGRIFYLYGPGEHSGRLVPQVVRAQLRGERLTLSNPALARDYLYVGDVADALACLLDSAVEGAVNIGSGTALSLRALVEQIGARLGRADLVDFGGGAAPRQEPPLVVADTARLAGELGWRPSVDLAHGLKLAVDFWRNRPDTTPV